MALRMTLERTMFLLLIDDIIYLILGNVLLLLYVYRVT